MPQGADLQLPAAILSSFEDKVIKQSAGMGVGYLIGSAPDPKSKTQANHKPSIRGVLIAVVPSELFGEDPLQVCQIISRKRLSLVLSRLGMDFLGIMVMIESDGGPSAASLLDHQKREQCEHADFFTIIVMPRAPGELTQKPPVALRLADISMDAVDDSGTSTTALSVSLISKGRGSRACIMSISTQDPIDDVEPILNGLTSGAGLQFVLACR